MSSSSHTSPASHPQGVLVPNQSPGKSSTNTSNPQTCSPAVFSAHPKPQGRRQSRGCQPLRSILTRCYVPQRPFARAVRIHHPQLLRLRPQRTRRRNPKDDPPRWTPNVSLPLFCWTSPQSCLKVRLRPSDNAGWSSQV